MILFGGDWPYYFSENLSSFSLPEIWSSVWPTGLGGNQAIILPLKLYLHGVVFLFVNTLVVPWEIVQVVFFFGLFIALSIYSSYKFTNSWIGALIYSTNTWVLMVFWGGQMGIALAYAIAPLAIKTWISLIQQSSASISKNFKFSMIAALFFAIEVMFDIRVAFLTMLVVLGYTIFCYFFVRRFNLKQFTVHGLLFTLITVLLHAFWIMPSVIIALRGGNVTSVVDTSATSLEFLSFAKFENSLSLLHPNWPENIFGKVSFMKAEFILIPILAFFSLWFFKIKSRNNAEAYAEQHRILFFVLVGLIGAFLAKGTQEPFGGLFSWLYSNIPGFNLFRDPVKFYILIALSYSVLIPYSLSQFRKFKKIIPIAFVLFWVYLNSSFILGPGVRILKQRSVPAEYVRLKDHLVSEKDFFRTLWVPNTQRFAFMSDNHPTISYQDLFKSNFASEFRKQEFQTLLSELSIKYVIVPYDSDGEIFLNDRKYDDKLYQKTIAELNKILWLKRVEGPALSEVEGFGKIAVYELTNPKSHFFLQETNVDLSFERKSATQYRVFLQEPSEKTLIFSENYDSNWHLQTNNERIYSVPFKGRLNSFNLPESINDPLTIRYEPQTWTNVGYLISFVTLTAIISFLVLSNFPRKMKTRAQAS